jgi:hypothetical protein
MNRGVASIGRWKGVRVAVVAATGGVIVGASAGVVTVDAVATGAVSSPRKPAISMI